MITEEQRNRYRENQKNFRLRLKTEQGQREYQAKKFANRMKNEYKGFKFACDGITTSIEVNLPFRCMTFIERQKRVDMKKYNEIQTNLKKMVGSVYQKSHIVVVEPEYAQIVILGNDENEVRNAICKSGAGHIGNYSDCTFNIGGIGTFKPLENTNPFLAAEGP